MSYSQWGKPISCRYEYKCGTVVFEIFYTKVYLLLNNRDLLEPQGQHKW